MEKRTLYIITSLIVLSLFSGLAFWYLYTIEQEIGLNDVTELDLYDTGQGSMLGNSSNTTTVGTPTKEFGNFGLSNNTNEIITPTNTEDEVVVAKDEEDPETWELIQIHSEPVSGASILLGGAIQLTDSKTGNILERGVDGIKNRVSAITILDILSSYTLSAASTLIIHNNKPATLVKISGGGESTHTETDYVDLMLQTTQSDEYLYYITPSNTGIDLKSTQDVSKTLWSSPLSNWLLQSLDKYLVITQKPSYNIPGYSYLINKLELDKGNSTLVPIVQDLPGLLVNVSPDATQLLYSTTGKDGLVLNLKDLSTKEVIPLSIKTLASKCAWGSGGTVFYCAIPTGLTSKTTHSLPDSWHKGQVHFKDSLWRIDPSTGDAVRLASDTGLDIIELQEGGDGKLILFKNKSDSSLWAVISNKLKQDN